MAILTLISIFALLAAANANVFVGIQAAYSKDNVAVELLGENSSVITSEERSVFNLTDDNIRQGIWNHHQGSPQDFYLNDPTGDWNLYSQFNWRPTTVVIKPVVANVMDVTTAPESVLTQTFTNDHPTLSANFNVQLTQQIQNRVSTSWSKSFSVASTSSISFGISGFGVGGAISFANSWGVASEASETVTIGTSAGLQITLAPGEFVVAELVATRGSMVVDIDYEASLIGRVVANYPTKHHDSHFWAYDVNMIAAAAELPEFVVTNTQRVNVGFFSEGNIRLSDGKSRRVLGVYPCEITRA